MSISMGVKSVRAKTIIGAAVLALLAPAGAANAQMKQDEPDAMDVARTPLEDLNIASKDIPEVLVTAAENPYDASGLVDCNQIVDRIAVLDNTLGPDFDTTQQDGGGISTGRVAKSVVGSLLPFRGIVREVTGANNRRDEARLAVAAGMVRRGYLKGLGEARGCAYPARPRTGSNPAVAGVPDNIVREEP